MTTWFLNFDLSSCVYVLRCSPEVRCSVYHHQRGILIAPLWCISPENNLVEFCLTAAQAPHVNFQWNLDSPSNLSSISFHSMKHPKNATPPCSLPPWVLIASSYGLCHGGIPYLSMFRWSSCKLGHVVTGESLLVHYLRFRCALVGLFVASNQRACLLTRSRYPLSSSLFNSCSEKNWRGYSAILSRCQSLGMTLKASCPTCHPNSNLSPPHSRIPLSVPNMPAHRNHYLIPPLGLFLFVSTCLDVLSYVFRLMF